MQSTRQSVAGFTIIELLLYLVIASTVLGAMTIFTATLLENRVKNQTIAEVEQQGAFAMAVMTTVLRNADTISAPATGASAAATTVTVSTGAKSPTVFDLSGGALRIKEGAGAATALTNARVTASGVTFQNLSRAATPGTLRIQFTLTAGSSSGRNEYAFQKTFIATATLR